MHTGQRHFKKKLVKRIVVFGSILALIIPSLVFANDDFSDGNFTYADGSGKKYSITSIFTDYNVFLFGSLNQGNHIEGAIAVEQDVKANANFCFGDLSTGTSYVAGKLEMNDFNNQSGGTIRLGQRPNDTLLQSFNNKSKDGTPIYYIEKPGEDKSYIDFKTARDKLVAESQTIYDTATKTDKDTDNDLVSYDKNSSTVTINLSKLTSENNNIAIDYSYFKKDNEWGNIINFTGSDVKDMSKPLYISFYNIPKTVQMPQSYFNGG